MAKRPIAIWWCPECGAPQISIMEPCDQCGADFVLAWRCYVCDSIVADDKCECGNNREKNRVNSRRKRLLDRQLRKVINDRGETVFEKLQRVVKYGAWRRGVPDYVAEETFSHAMEKLLRYIDDYNPTKGAFINWASVICKNTMSNEVRDDVTENSRHLALEGVTDAMWDDKWDDKPARGMIEALSADFGIQTIVEHEQRLETARRQYEIARQVLGTYETYRDNEWVQVPIIDVYLEAWIETGGRGWLTRSAEITGIPKHKLSRWNSKARLIWQKRQKEMGMW